MRLPRPFANVWARRRWRLLILGSLGAAGVLALGFFAYVQLVKGAWIPYNKWDRRQRGALRVGQPAPDLELPLLGQGSVRLSELWRSRPLFLVFGSCT